MFGLGDWSGGGWMGGGMWVLWILLIIVAVVFIKGLTALAPDSPAGRHESQSPLEILKTRYARGEINEEEFERRRHELEK